MCSGRILTAGDKQPPHAQVALRWITQSGASFTVEAKSAAHFAEDLALFDWQLDQEDMARLEAINKQPYYEKSVTAPDA